MAECGSRVLAGVISPDPCTCEESSPPKAPGMLLDLPASFSHCAALAITAAISRTLPAFDLKEGQTGVRQK